MKRYNKIKPIETILNNNYMIKGNKLSLNNIEISEKIDGSNFSIKKINNQLEIYSRNQRADNERYYKTLQNLNLDELEENKIYFGEILGQGKLQYNRDKPNYYYLFDCFDIQQNRYLEDNEWTHSKKINKEFINISENTNWDEIFKKYYSKSKVLKNYDCEGIVIKFQNHEQKYKFVRSDLKEIVKLTKQLTYDPNIRLVEKWIQKFVYEEPVNNWKEFIIKCKEDFKSEHQGKLNTKIIQILIEDNNLNQLEYKEVSTPKGIILVPVGFICNK